MENDPDFTIIKQGAEAKIYKGIYLQKPTIVKERFTKKYRHPDLDKSISKDRIKAEARAITRCKEAGIFTPALYLIDLTRRCIFMEEIQHCVTAKDYINNFKGNEQTEETKRLVDNLAKEIGTSISKMHLNAVIHGDLTTSNILFKDGTVYFIDFGLSQSSSAVEDKAVDLYVLERALLSTHENSKQLFDAILRSYQSFNKKSSSVIVKLDEVRARGRKRTMLG